MKPLALLPLLFAVLLSTACSSETGSDSAPTPRPEVTAISAPSAVAGENVTINGSGFQSGLTVSFAGKTGRVNAQVVSQTATAVTVKVPADARPGTIELVNPDGQKIATQNFKVMTTLRFARYVETAGPSFVQLTLVADNDGDGRYTDSVARQRTDWAAATGRPDEGLTYAPPSVGVRVTVTFHVEFGKSYQFELHCNNLYRLCGTTSKNGEPWDWDSNFGLYILYPYDMNYTSRCSAWDVPTESRGMITGYQVD